MIAIGTKIKLRPNLRYKDQPEKDCDFYVGDNSYGKYLQFQVLDANNVNTGKSVSGFFYIQIFTELPLAVDDMVTIKEIMYVQRKGNVCVFGCKIQENPIMGVTSDLKNDVGF
jgi:hypothetical protein